MKMRKYCANDWSGMAFGLVSLSNVLPGQAVGTALYGSVIRCREFVTGLPPRTPKSKLI